MNHINRRKAATFLVITALFASILAIPNLTTAATPAAGSMGKIVFDYSHGQESTNSEVVTADANLEGNLTEMGYEVVWARGGINATILSDAVGFVAGSIYGAGNGYLAAEVTAISDWFNAGNKFMWIGYDSDYTSAPDAGQWNNDNMTLILEAVGSHIYGEPTAVEDPVSNAGAGYRPVANTTTDNPDLAAIVEGVSAVLMHGPTLVYGADGAAETSPVALESGTIDNVYPLLYYGANATINDGDIIDPIVHTNNQQGSFVATAMELYAGEDGSSALIVSGASPYGDYRPMCADYYNVPLDGYNLVLQGIKFGIIHATSAQGEGKIVFDYSHGQESSNSEVVHHDKGLRTSLFLKGYTTYWARGGINSTILADAVGFIAGSIYGAGNGYLAAEVTAISDWYNEGRKFMWIGYDSDYTSAPDAGQWNNDNMTLILDAIGSHIYGEPTAVEDPVSNAGAGYRPVANTTSDNAFVADIVEGVSAVLMHGPTCLYWANGSSTTTPAAMEGATFTNVYPLLYYGGNATINDGDTTDPLAHTNGQQGSFVAAALEIHAGENETGNLIVSGASPYGDYRPMYADYYNVPLDGYNLILNGIDFGISTIEPLPEPTTEPTGPTTTTSSEPGPGLPIDTTTLLLIGGAAVVVIIIIVVVAKRR
jgi:hypothetical protein